MVQYYKPNVFIMSTPTFRKLRGYAFDPSFSSTIGRRQSNLVIYKVKWEELTPASPYGEYIDILDYDPTTQNFYEQINLDDKYVLADYGLDPSEGDPKFHQQQVYAVIMTVLAQFEKALGRKIIWVRRKEEGSNVEYLFEEKLRVYPHGLRQQNAFYSPEKIALIFGYFQASEIWSGNNVPGVAIFTCLSPDIVAHEVTHAILDSLHPYWQKNTNPDILAFHEGFSDIIALLQRFTFSNVVEDQIRNSKGDLLSPQNLLGDLAIQFGQAVSSNRRALRSYLVEMKDGKNQLVEPDPSKYHTETEPHNRGAILVAAIFDAFARLYKHQVADLIRLSSNGSGILAQGEIPPDLVKRLSCEAREIADKLMLVCIRALDYCPPIDLTFGDYLRALITADVENYPDEEAGLRFALLESFRSWGIIPEGINNYSVESLLWKPFEKTENKVHEELFEGAIQYIFNPDIKNDEYHTNKINSGITDVIKSVDKILRETERKTIYEESKNLSAKVHNIFQQKFEYFFDESLKFGMEKVLGMNFNNILYNLLDGDNVNSIELNAPQRLNSQSNPIFQVYKCRPVIRNNSQDGSSTKLMIITFLQKVFVNLENSNYEGLLEKENFDMRGGATIIIDLTNYKIKYAIIKDISDANRLKKQLDYSLEHISDADNSALLMQGKEPFAALHSH